MTAPTFPDLPLLDTLFAEPERFEFFQAVTILERAAAQAGGARVGRDAGPGREAVRFHAEQTRAFPGTEIAELTPADGDTPPDMTVSFLGLTGASGVLPLHYTDAVIFETRRNDLALGHFLDLFNHRAISLFFRAWEKYRLPAAYGLAPGGTLGTALHRDDGVPAPYNLAPTGTLQGNDDDPITAALFALIGFGTPGLRRRLGLSDQGLLRYAGLLSHRPRSAAGLEAMLSDDLERSVTVEQFRGSWVAVRPEDQTRMPDPDNPDGRFCRLGIDAVVGERVWDVQGGFRLRLGPLGYRDFLEALPGGVLLPRVARLTRLYVGPDMSFDLQVILAREEVPVLCLGTGDGPEAPRLGWNTWIKGADFTRDADDAVFSLDHFAP